MFTEMNVNYVDHMGDDKDVVNAARVSFNKETKDLREQDTKLLHFLAKNDHWTPYAHCFLKLRVKVPIFVARQWFKHTVGFAYNEVSRRYVSSKPELFDASVWRGKPEGNIKQGSSSVIKYIDDTTHNLMKEAVNHYNELIENGIAPEIEEYFVYTPKPNYPTGNLTGGGGNKGTKIAKDAITYCTSGLVDRNKGSVLSYLHKAIKALNQLRMIEDSLVIYRLSRAPERRIFYIDVGNLPKVKAEQYLKEVMSRYRNKLVYDANTGEIRDDRKFMSMMEDFWLPRREGGRGTEITTLPGGQNLGELADIEYFQKKLYRALGVPESRIAADGGFNLGRSSEILRDELKFAKFVGRLRKRFAQMFNDMLKTQLILKNIVSVEDWDRISDHIQYDFLYDNQFAELKETEMLNERLGVLSSIEPYIGKYYSQRWVRSKVLRQTDGEMIEMDEQIEQEIKDGIIPDPSAIDPITGEPLPQEGEQGMMGDVPMEPEIDGGMTEVDGKAAEI